MKIILSCIIMFAVFSCKTTAPLGAEVTYKSYTNQIMSVESIGYGAKTPEALENAKKNAIDVILFRGVPNSSLNRPLVGTDKQTALQKNKKYFKELYKNRRYSSFITQAVSITPFKKLENGSKGLKATVKVNIQALRVDMENNGIIRKFGY